MGASLLKQLSAVSAPHKPQVDHSLESAIVEAAATADGNIESLSDIAATVNQHVGEISTGICVADSLTDVVDNTIAIYGEGGIDEQGAELLRISVESILKVGGINIPAEMVAPSFESVTGNYSAEVATQKGNVISRIMTWLHAALQSISESMKSFWLRLTNSSKSVEEYAKKVAERVKAVDGELKDPAATINVGADALWLTGRSDHISKPDRHVVETVARFEDFVVEWRNLWGSIIDFQFPSPLSDPKNMEVLNKKLHDLAVSTVKGTKPVKIDITVGHAIDLKPGAGEVPMLTATTKVVVNVTVKDKTAPVLTKDEMKHGIDTVLEAFGVLKKLEKDMDKVGQTTLRVSRLTKSVSVKDTGVEIKESELRQTLKALSKACGFASWGWTNAVPYYLKTLKACVKYIDASASRYS